MTIISFILSGIVVITFYLVALCGLRRRRGNTWYVNNSSPYASDSCLYSGQGASWGYPFATLNHAIEQCSKYDTILVGQGHFEITGCNLTIDMNTSIKIEGQNANRPYFTLNKEGN